MPMLNKPRSSADMVLAEMAYNAKQAKKEERKQALSERAEAKKNAEAISIMETTSRRDAIQNKFAVFSEDTKTKLLAYAISEVAMSAMGKVNEKVGRPVFTGRESGHITALTYNFINENGKASSIISAVKRSTPTMYLSELCNNIKKTHREILEHVDRSDPNSFNIGDGVMKDYKDSVHNSFGHDDLVDMIADRVTASIQQFITQNAEDKDKIVAAMTATKDKVESLGPNASEELKESYTNLGRRLVTDIRNQKHGLFNEMVMTMSKSVLKSNNEAVREHYLNGAHINMEAVVNGTATMYTFLETVNAMRLIKIDENYIHAMLESMMEV